eukprot:TRINITY_DN5711_c0_g1_i1.p1 TRINITY_DN5711_c0_g1~~TRINITY_DN5711_c0_g1_i1.p1  ORF type:complete len:142 (+),score=2.61 TRINITY_DN5711_c0_g1_i1:40-465(+)
MTERSTLTIVGVVSFYFCISLSLVFLNKALMKGLEFPYPLFISWYQLIIAQVAIVVFGWLGQRIKIFPLYLFAPWEWDTQIARKVLPLSLVFVAMLSFNNICLQHVEVSMYQVYMALKFINKVLGSTTIDNCLDPNPFAFI